MMTPKNPTLPFSIEEYQDRLARTRAAMAEGKADALIVTDPSNMAWLTGHDGWSFHMHQAVIVLASGDPIWWGRARDAAGAARAVWMQDDSVKGYGEHFVQSRTAHPMQDLAVQLVHLGVASGRIGVELDSPYFSARAMHTLNTSLPKATWSDATGTVNRLRCVKSAAEIGFMRKAASISEAMIEGLLERVEPGVAKNEVAAELHRDAIRGVGEAWGDYPAIVPRLRSGRDGGAPHVTWDGRAFASGEATVFELSGCYRRYHAPLCRTLFLGTPPEALKRAEAAVLEGLEAGLEAARPGNRAGDIAEALQGALQRAGIERDGRCGYSIGLSHPPDWSERTVSLRSEDETILEPGMCFHFTPGCRQDDWALEISEPILIRETGAAEPLCNRPRQLFVKP